MASSRPCSSSCSSQGSLLAWALTLASLGLLSSCAASGVSVILVPALPATQTQVRIAESFRAKVFVTLPDGTMTISKRRMDFPAGSWISLVSAEEIKALLNDN